MKNLGLAGPPAPILHWAGHLQEGPQNTHVLPFRSLAVLPAELLAIPVPTISWAFEEVPVMSLSEWEGYRRRSTSTVLIMTAENKLYCSYRLLMEGPRKILPIIGSFWQQVCFLIFSHHTHGQGNQQCFLSAIGPRGTHQPRVWNWEVVVATPVRKAVVQNYVRPTQH